MREIEEDCRPDSQRKHKACDDKGHPEQEHSKRDLMYRLVHCTPPLNKVARPTRVGTDSHTVFRTISIHHSTSSLAALPPAPHAFVRPSLLTICKLRSM